MGYRRNISPVLARSGGELESDMVGIGMLLRAEPNWEANIEDTLLFASLEALEHDYIEMLSVLVSWLEVHSPWINADRLTRLISREKSKRTRAFWAALSTWKQSDRRFARLGKLHRGRRVDLIKDAQTGESEEDQRFAGSPLRVPGKVIEDRAADILEPENLAAMNETYRQRVRMGPTYRADMWAALEADPSLSAAELARKTYGSFATAWQVKRDWRIVTGER
jgi:hypothetical protein